MASARSSGKMLATKTALLLFWTIECLDRMERDNVLLVCQVAKNGVPLLFYHVRLLVTVWYILYLTYVCVFVHIGYTCFLEA